MKTICTLFLSFFLFSCTVKPFDSTALKYNEIQFIGSHNSYKKPIDSELLAQLADNNKALAQSLDYAHLPLQQQLDLGIRKIELDVFYDPDGGRYLHPLGLTLTEHPSPYHSEKMHLPGFKVMHVQDLDFRSHCQLFADCLQAIRTWSGKNEGHLPVVITINAKDEIINLDGYTRPLKFDKKSWTDLDREINKVLGDALYSPDDFRRGEVTLPDAIKLGWPLLDKMRSRVLVVLDHEGSKLESYIDGHKALRGRAMFVNAKEGMPESAIRIVNNPVADFSYIQSLVQKGYIVRTRADADTKEARIGSTTRREKAFASGAQIISTDYYIEDARFESGYKVSLPNAVVAICNPLLVKKKCEINE